MRAVIVAALFFATFACALPKWHELEGYTFDMYVADTLKPYPRGSKTYNERKAIFEARLADIKRHNADKSMSWKRGVNQFADWTDDEFLDYQRARVPTEAEFAKHRNVDTFTPTRDPSSLPRQVDYRLNVNPPVLTGVKNQGSCGSCWAHSATESLESYFALKFGQLPVLSQQQVTSCTQTCFGCGGGSFVQGWDYVNSQGGLNEDWTYPYVNFFASSMSQGQTQACRNITELFPTITKSDGKKFTFTWWPKANATGYTRVEKNNANAMLEALATVGPQSISVAASKQWADYESGILVNQYKTYAQNISWQEINHDVQMVGYGHDDDLNMNYWTVRNSWGTNYGEAGFIRLYRPEVEVCGTATGQKICGTSGVLCNPGFPKVDLVNKQNGYYF